MDKTTSPRQRLEDFRAFLAQTKDADPEVGTADKLWQLNPESLASRLAEARLPNSEVSPGYSAFYNAHTSRESRL